MPKLQGPGGNTLRLMLLPVPTPSCLLWGGLEAACAPTPEPAGLSLPLKPSPMCNSIFQAHKNAPCTDLGTRSKFYLTRHWPAKASSLTDPRSGLVSCVGHEKSPPSGADNGMLSSQFTPTSIFWGPLQYLDLILRYLLILLLSNEAPHVGDWKA